MGDGRALVAVPQPEAKVFLSWRMLAVDGAGHGAGAKGDRVERVDDRAPPNYSVQRRVAGGEWEGITTSSPDAGRKPDFEMDFLCETWIVRGDKSRRRRGRGRR